MKYLLGIDIGGTKCAASLGKLDNDGNIEIIAKKKLSTTRGNPQKTIAEIFDVTDKILADASLKSSDISAIGISCGGPLDSVKGVVMNPPNLPAWDNIEVVKIFTQKYGVKCALQNDANAGALAEWKFGAGRGLRNMVFMTFGTGLGAGLILDGKLYAGTNDNAGEVGHIRLSEFGPVGYGKSGSFEGFCSGGGIAQIARAKVAEKLQSGDSVSFCKSESDLAALDAKIVADAAENSDPLAREIYAESGRMLGRGLAIIVDILNPQAIVIGSIFARSQELIWPSAEKVLKREALGISNNVCKVVAAKLGDSIGDYAALSVAAYII